AGPLAEDLLLRVAHGANQALDDETRRPPVYVTSVLEQVPDRPPRAGRHPGSQAGPLRFAGEQLPLAAQRPDIAGDIEGGVRAGLPAGKDATSARAAPLARSPPRAAPAARAVRDARAARSPPGHPPPLGTRSATLRTGPVMPFDPPGGLPFRPGGAMRRWSQTRHLGHGIP